MIATAAGHPLLDNIANWGRASTWERPVFNVEGFQRRIDDIVGKNRDGKSIVVLRWMRSRDCYDEYFTEWDAAGMPLKSHLRAKYRAFGVELPDGTMVEIVPPRWVLEQRYEPEQLEADWESSRWQIEDGRRVPIKPGIPREGYYSHLYTIASHDEKCCQEALDTASVCWGKYRLPSDKDLNMLREIVRRRDADTVRGNPYGQLDEATQIEVSRRVKEQIREQDDLKKFGLKERIADAMRPHLHRLTDDPSVLKHGKYHFMSDRKGATKDNDSNDSN